MQKGANARATCAILCIINIEPKTVLQMYIKNRIRIRIIHTERQRNPPPPQSSTHQNSKHQHTPHLVTDCANPSLKSTSKKTHSDQKTNKQTRLNPERPAYIKRSKRPMVYSCTQLYVCMSLHGAKIGSACIHVRAVYNVRVNKFAMDCVKTRVNAICAACTAVYNDVTMKQRYVARASRVLY